ncbi:hypothetical protein [Sphingomonas sp. 3-13AW]|uniref:hypothetical protein n=1 Tax=Sphingomonas sp. 3-13AW TaxID=3050450 RepID=UPI003BB630AE
MRMGKLLTAVVASSLIAAPAMANGAASLSVAKSVKASTSAKQSNELAGGGIFIGVLAAAAVIAGIVVAVDNDDKSDSN